VLGPRHPDTLKALNRLASLHQAQGRPVEAGSAFQTRPAVPEAPRSDTPTSLVSILVFIGLLVLFGAAIGPGDEKADQTQRREEWRRQDEEGWRRQDEEGWRRQREQQDPNIPGTLAWWNERQREEYREQQREEEENQRRRRQRDEEEKLRGHYEEEERLSRQREEQERRKDPWSW
jgi:hypothetical protein